MDQVDYEMLSSEDDGSTKTPATISIDASLKEDFIEGLLDEQDCLLLGKKSAQRDELFLFAMALGWKNKLPVDLDKPCSGGFIRTSSFSSQLVSTIDLIHFANNKFESKDNLRDHKESYRIAEKYANGGLRLLRGEINDANGDSEVIANTLIEEMDKMADEYGLS